MKKIARSERHSGCCEALASGLPPAMDILSTQDTCATFGMSVTMDALAWVCNLSVEEIESQATKQGAAPAAPAAAAVTAAADAAPALAPDVRDAGVDAAPQPQIVRASIGPADGSSASASTATADLGGLTGGASTAAAAAAVTTPAAAVTIPAAALAAVTSPADAFAELQRHKTDHEKVCGIMSALIAADRLWLGDAEHASIIARAMVIHRTHAGVVKLATTIIKRLAREPDAIPAVATRQVIQCLLVALPLLWLSSSQTSHALHLQAIRRRSTSWLPRFVAATHSMVSVC